MYKGLLKKWMALQTIRQHRTQALPQRLLPGHGASTRSLHPRRFRLRGRAHGDPATLGGDAAATLASTGTPSLFLHPAEAIHGDLGMVRSGDVMILISNSGETEEIVRLLPALQRLDAARMAASSSEVILVAPCNRILQQLRP